MNGDLNINIGHIYKRINIILKKSTQIYLKDFVTIGKFIKKLLLEFEFFIGIKSNYHSKLTLSNYFI